jgi:eukaryotic-like serine/threonine-protein kinase
MADPRFRQLQDLFEQAVDKDEAEQDAFADVACDGDPTLRDELCRLLRRHRARRVLSDRPVLPELESALREAVPAAFVEGRKVGPFRIIEPIGDGGMGRVYRAVREEGDVEQEVAIKLIRGELVNPALLARFSVERRVLAALNHPNICRFLDAGSLSDGTPFVVMELVCGKPLYEYCDEHRLDLAQRIRLLRKIVGAVAHAHHQLIVHRDIKSSNVLVDAHGEPKLLDFGIAKSLSGRDGQTLTSERFFTPGSAAPEQLRGEPAGVGCDIHALGALAYGLLCGRPPFDFEGLRPGEVERLLLEVPPQPVSQRAAEGSIDAALTRGFSTGAALARALRGELDSVVATCLRKSPAERYRSAEQLDADFAAVLEHRPVSARGSDVWYRARKFVARHRLSVALVSILTITLVAGASTVASQAYSLARQQDRIILERDRAQQLVELLKESFIGADPARVSGASVQLGDVLDSARPRVEALRASQPALYASLAATIAEVELGLGRDTVALKLARSALATLGDDPALSRSLLLLEARALTTMGDHTSAQMALAAVAQMDTVPQPDWMVANGRSLGRLGRYDEAIVTLEQAVEQLSDRSANDALAILARTELAYALDLSGDLAAAVAIIDEMLAWQARTYPSSHPSLLRTRIYRADLLRLLGMVEQSVQEARLVHGQVAEAYGAGSLMAASAAEVLANALDDSGATHDAIALTRELIETWSTRLGPTHARTIRTQFNLAMVLKKSPDAADDAIALLRKTVVAAESGFGLQANSTHHMRNALARLLLEQHQGEEALALLVSDSALAGIESMMPSNRNTYRELVAVAAADCGRRVEPLEGTCSVAVKVLESGAP